MGADRRPRRRDQQDAPLGHHGRRLIRREASNPSESGAATLAAHLALAEDLGVNPAPPFSPGSDLSTKLTLDESARRSVEAVYRARGAGILAGTLPATEVMAAFLEPASTSWTVEDGFYFDEGDVIGTVSGPLATVLAGERASLNFLCHLSGIATATRKLVRIVEEIAPGCRLRDTRKTTPGLRQLEKAAVRAGGGSNHRSGLFDGILVKDNHIAELVVETATSPAEAVREAVRRARLAGTGMLVEIEADTLEQVEAAIDAGVDTVLCDNMSTDELREAVRIAAGRAEIEASGGVDETNIAEIAATGVDYIAVGAITHSAPVIDIGLDF